MYLQYYVNESGICHFQHNKVFGRYQNHLGAREWVQGGTGLSDAAESGGSWTGGAGGAGGAGGGVGVGAASLQSSHRETTGENARQGEMWAGWDQHGVVQPGDHQNMWTIDGQVKMKAQ